LPENTISVGEMKRYLSRSMPNVNRNKVNGVLAEIEFRRHIETLGFLNRVSAGGWIARNKRNNFSHHVVALFPETIEADQVIVRNDIPLGLHTICATFHQIGIKSFFSYPTIRSESSEDVDWKFQQLGIPSSTQVIGLDEVFANFEERTRNYNYLRYHSDSDIVPDEAIPEEFSKENLRVFFASSYFAEISDIDGILWGEEKTYPIEIKEKTPAEDTDLGEYFGLDVGPFTKLAFYAAKKGNLHSIFIVREIDHEDTRNLVNWYYITYDRLAQYASWVQRGGGTSMGGGRSTVIRIPKREFSVLNEAAMNQL
jgi:hypothetical protein